MNVIFIPHTSCTGCGACLNACPISCISMELDEEKFYYPKINESKCTNCKKCEKVCPVANKKTVEKETKAFAVVANDDNIRMNSSSGGAFTLLSQHIILGGG
jgi:ferredoxin